ncbi:MAG: methylcrotonoyl-CoA carboxylase, partial [Sinobacteraceae bacterium]|nr:methylcrotonoyl-CoA carboxylase [Nevskiaceae bacterium]
MPALTSRIDVHSEEFADNQRQMRELVADLQHQVQRAAQGGSAAAVKKHRAGGKLTARERIRTLLDTGSPFLELSQLAAHG